MDSNSTFAKEYSNSIIIKEFKNNSFSACFMSPISIGSSLWLENSLRIMIPVFAVEFAFILAINRLFIAISASTHVPRIVVLIFVGILTGESILGQVKNYYTYVVPYIMMMPIETLAGLTLVYYVFLMGLEVDLKILKRCRTKSIVLAIVNIIITIPIGCGLYYLLITNMGLKPMPPALVTPHFRAAMIWGFALTCSEFPEIAHILSDLKLLLTDNGQLALSASLINDLISWMFLPVVLAEYYYRSSLAIVITIFLVFASLYIVYPFVERLVNNIGIMDRDCIETKVVFLLHLVLVFGLIADGLGTYSITGAFVLGLLIPRGMLSDTIQDKVHDFVAEILMPLYFCILGQRISFHDLTEETNWTTVFVFMALAFVTKILCTTLVFSIYRMPLNEGLSVGLLMNTKGILSIIILCSARNKLSLSSGRFGVMLVTCWLMTVPVGPILAATKTFGSTNYIGKTRRTMRGTRPDSPLRVLACVHTKRDANVIITLLKASCPSVKSPIQVIAVELKNMVTHWSRPVASSLIIKDARKPSFNMKSSKRVGFNEDNSNHHDNDTLGSFDNISQAIFVEKMRVASDYKSMHTDIFNIAKQRGVTLILTITYRQPTYDGLGAGTATAKAANIINRDRESKDKTKVVLENLVNGTPCSLAIFVDRGFGQKQTTKEEKLAMFYVAGADDREALSYAWRMSRNSLVHLTVVRLVWNNNNDEFDKTDEEFLKCFVRQMMDTPWAKYMEKVVKDEKETVAVLNKIANKGFDLFIIGRGHGRKMSLAQTVDPVLDEPALGPLGDTLSDLNSAAETSILILQ